MQVVRMGAAALLFSLVACHGFPFFTKTAGSDTSTDGRTAGVQSTPARFVLELQKIKFDGETLSGRFIVGVEDGRLTLDRRLIENVSVQVRSVSDCTTGQPIGFFLADSFPEPASEAELITLTPGQWYGANVQFSLFDEKLTRRAPPDCFEIELWLTEAAGSVVGQLRARVERTSRQEAPEASGALMSDGGVESPDAGRLNSAPDASVRH